MNTCLLFISGPEIFIIIVVVLVLFGAKGIPQLARSLGKGMSEFKKATSEIKRELNENELYQDVKNGAGDMLSDIKESTSDLTQDIQEIKRDFSKTSSESNDLNSTEPDSKTENKTESTSADTKKE